MELKRRADDRRQKDLGGYEATPGYAINGESKWTRQAASGGSADTTTNTATKERQEWSRLDELIHHEAHQVRRLRRRVEAETDPAKVAVLLDRLTKTRTLLDRLRNEQRALVP
jgi:hypothetical protein